MRGTLYIAFAALLSLVAGPAWAVGFKVDRLEAGVFEALPHGEPDVLKPSRGDIARSALMAGGGLTLGRATLDVDLTWWGTQPWRAPEVVGSGLNAWAGTNWRVDSWAWQMDAMARLRLAGPVSACVKHENGARQPYYWLVGICARWP